MSVSGEFFDPQVRARLIEQGRDRVDQDRVPGEWADLVADAEVVAGLAGGRQDRQVVEVETALAALRRLSAGKTAVERAVLETAQAAGMSWSRVAEVCGYNSKQAAEQRYLRLRGQRGAGGRSVEAGRAGRAAAAGRDATRPPAVDVEAIADALAERGFEPHVDVTGATRHRLRRIRVHDTATRDVHRLTPAAAGWLLGRLGAHPRGLRDAHGTRLSLAATPQEVATAATAAITTPH